MIIGTTHRYLFVERPPTGSMAVAKELFENYGAQVTFRKRSTYQDFQRSRLNNGGEYFLDFGIRHPLDQVVSRDRKLKGDHKGESSCARFREFL